MQILDYTHNWNNNWMYFVLNEEYSNSRDTDIYAFSTSTHENYNSCKTQILTIKLLKLGFCTKKMIFLPYHTKNLH